MHRTRAFTLIELMVVVAIFAFASAILVPNFLRALDQSRKSAVSVETPSTRQPRPSSAATPRPSGGRPPVLKKADISLRMTTRLQRLGMDVFNRYDLEYNGQFDLEGAADVVRLEFPLPLESTEARDVSLTLRCGDTRWEPSGVTYDNQGILWVGNLQQEARSHQADGSAPLQVAVNYTASGRERCELSLPRAERLRAVDMRMQMEGPCVVAEDSLQPTSSAAGMLQWRFNNLVTDRHLVLELPAAQSPLGRVVLLCKLVGLAVLFFGLGFWYLNELDVPGRLDTFRWGHFLLLALTYSLFFVIFAVLAFHAEGSPWGPMEIAAACSLPLLLLHSGRIVGFRFALTRVLPLTVFTLLLVVGGVYAGPLRDYLFIAAAVLVVAFATITYPRWMAQRSTYRQSREAEVLASIAALQSTVAVARDLLRRGQQALATSDSPSLTDDRATVERWQKAVSTEVERYSSVLGTAAEMQRETNGSVRDFHRVQAQRAAASIQRGLEGGTPNLTRALDSLQHQRSESSGAAADRSHCLACGKTCGDTAYCPHCGVARPSAIRCARCGDVLRIPTHLLKKEVASSALHCEVCGELVATAKEKVAAAVR